VVELGNDRRHEGREIHVLVNLTVEGFDDSVLQRVSPFAKIEYVFDRRSDAFVLGRAAIGPHRTVALLKHPDDGVAGASLIVDRFGGHLRWVAFEAWRSGWP
jgi:hypothetical protein